MELLHYWKVIRKNLWLILLTMVLGFGGSLLFALRQPLQYESSALLLLNPLADSTLSPGSAATKSKLPADLAESYNALVRTESFAQDVSTSLPFEMSPRKVTAAIVTKLTPNTLYYKITGTADSAAKAQQLVSTTVAIFLSTNQEQIKRQTDTNAEVGILRDELRKTLQTKLQDTRSQIETTKLEIKALEAAAPSKDRNDLLLTQRGNLVTLQQIEATTLESLVSITQMPGTVATPLIAEIVDTPQPGKALPSSVAQTVGLAVIVSLFLGVGLAFLRDYLDYTIRSPEYLEQLTGLSPVTAVGRLRRAKKSSSGAATKGGAYMPTGHRLVTIEQPQAPASESFRMLRTNIQLLNPEKPIRSLVVTSVQPKEGKSFVAANLAIVMAQAGNRTILVDADLRRSTQHELFELPNTVGFVDILQSKSPKISSVIQLVPAVDNLAVITSGILPENPSELLNSQQAEQIMAQLAQQVDVIIYDTPPAGLAIDAVILSTRVDAAVMVVGAGTTRREMVMRVKNSLQNIGVSAILPVLNKVKAEDLSGYYYAQYYRYSTRQQPTLNGHTNGMESGMSADEAAPYTKSR